jgi:uncharacterized pyridoxal phosphate-containing UPF0001 family protein
MADTPKQVTFYEGAPLDVNALNDLQSNITLTYQESLSNTTSIKGLSKNKVGGGRLKFVGKIDANKAKPVDLSLTSVTSLDSTFIAFGIEEGNIPAGVDITITVDRSNAVWKVNLNSSKTIVGPIIVNYVYVEVF